MHHYYIEIIVVRLYVNRSVSNGRPAETIDIEKQEAVSLTIK